MAEYIMAKSRMERRMSDTEKLMLFVLTALACPLCISIVFDMIERKDNGESN